MKICSKCKQEKDESEFQKCKKAKDGLQYSCRECRKISCKKYYNSDKGLISQQKYHRSEKGRKAQRDYSKTPEAMEKTKQRYSNYSKYDLYKRKVYAKLHYAIKIGKIIPNNNCEICGNTYYIQGHHNDYNYPLIVEWLCINCHMEKHRKHQ